MKVVKQTVNINGKRLEVKPNLTKEQLEIVAELQKIANNQNKKLN